jgi:hypothetical protein
LACWRRCDSGGVLTRGTATRRSEQSQSGRACCQSGARWLHHAEQGSDGAILNIRGLIFLEFVERTTVGAVSTRALIIAALVTGMVILVAFAVQVAIAL